MPKPLLLGDDFLDTTKAGRIVANPTYDSKTKYGKQQPKTIVDYTPGQLGTGAAHRNVSKIEQIQYTNADFGLNADEFKEAIDSDIPINAYSNPTELNKARAQRQTGMQQFGRFLNRFIGGEILVGIPEGFLNIVDGVVNSFTGDNYDKTWLGEKLGELHDYINETNKIYRRDPNNALDYGDSGWFFDNAVSIASTLSLMVPVMGYGKAASMLGRLGVGSRTLGGWMKYANRGIAKGVVAGASKVYPKLNKIGEEYSIYKNARNVGAVADTMKDWGKVSAAATASRMGENMMEADQVYKDIYTNSLENLNNMDDAEYQKFIQRNPDMKGLSKDEQAKEIARKSANETFTNDFAMLLMDIPQFKAIGKLWGSTRQFTKAADRIAAKNIKRKAAGLAAGLDEDAIGKTLIKNNIFNRTKEHFTYMLKNPLKSVANAEFSEGFEEMYQGVQQERGTEIAAKYFDPKYTGRSIESFIHDPEIWEQGLWGWIGGMAFQAAGGPLTTLKEKVNDRRMKKKLGAEDYEKWKKAQDEANTLEMNKFFEQTNLLMNRLNKLKENKNPFNFIIDEETGVEVIKGNDIVEETISNEQRDLLKDRAINEFLSHRTMDAVDRGQFDLMKEILTSDEFDQYLTKNGFTVENGDKKLYHQMADKMQSIADAYRLELENVEWLADESNPYVINAVARNIVDAKLKDNIYDEQLNAILATINAKNTQGINYDTYRDKQIHDAVKPRIDALNNLIQNIESQFNNKEISKSARDKKITELNARKKALIETVAKHTLEGSLQEVKDMLKDTDVNIDELVKVYDNYVAKFNNNLLDTGITPPPTAISQLYKQYAEVLTKKESNLSTIPIDEKGYKDIYDDFAYSMEKYAKDTINNAKEKIREYLMNAENPEEAIEKLLTENTGNDAIDRYAALLKYGYRASGLNQMAQIKALNINAGLAQIFQEVLQARTRQDEIRQDAAENNMEVINDETQNNNTEETSAIDEETTEETTEETATNPTEDNTESNPSTGEGLQVNLTPTETAETASTETTAETENPTTIEEAESTSSNPVVSEDETPVVDNPVQTTEEVAASNEILPIGQDEIDAILLEDATELAEKYLIVRFIKEPGLIQSLKGANQEVNYNKLIQQVIGRLSHLGLDNVTLQSLARNAITDIINDFAAEDKKGDFVKVAEDLARGFSKEDVANTEIKEAESSLITRGKDLPKLVQKFLEEYSKKRKGIKIGDKYVVNINDLFNYLINNPDITKRTAIMIYNNLNRYLATNNEENYIFTGFTDAMRRFDAETFFKRLNETKVNADQTINDMHIHLIEDENRHPNFKKALIALHNGECTLKARKGKNIDGDYIYTEFYTDYTNEDGVTEEIKIGIIRNLTRTADNNVYKPLTFNTGFANEITVDGENITLDSEFLFQALIDNNTPEANELFNVLTNFNMRIVRARILRKTNRITAEQFREKLLQSLSDEEAKRIINNPLIQKLLSEGHFRYHLDTEIDRENKDYHHAVDLANSISKILFYGDGFNNGNSLNNVNLNLSFDAITMAEAYEMWKESLLANYQKNADLQDRLNNANEKDISIANAQVNTYSVLNIIDDPQQYLPLSLAGFDTDTNSQNYTPLVYVNSNHMYVDEHGKVYGRADYNMGPYSMGFVVGDINGQPVVAAARRAIPIKGTELHHKLRKDIGELIQRQLTNFTTGDEHANEFYNLTKRLYDIFNRRGLFAWGNIKAAYDRNKNAFRIYEVDNTGNKTQDLLVFWKNSENGIPGVNISIVNTKEDIYQTAGKDKEPTKKKISAMLDRLLENVSLNRMEGGFIKKDDNQTYYRNEKGQFVINIGGEETVYNSYADFVVSSNAFLTDMDGRSGSFMHQEVSDYALTIDSQTGQQQTSNFKVKPTNTKLTDLVDKAKAKTRKLKNGARTRPTFNTIEFLQEAGIAQSSIDLLTGITGGKNTQMFSDKTYYIPGDANSPFAYYDDRDKCIYVTDKGIGAMSDGTDGPVNTLRLLMHENLHRLFHSKELTTKERQRIVNELKEVYEYTIAKLQEEVANNTSYAVTAQKFINLFNKVLVKDDATNMEEFLMESLTQPLLVDYLNKTAYKHDSNIFDIEDSNKTIFQKLIDILLKLFGIRTQNINKSSILAREYAILSKTAKPTHTVFDDNNTSNQTNTENNSNNGRVYVPAQEGDVNQGKQLGNEQVVHLRPETTAAQQQVANEPLPPVAEIQTPINNTNTNVSNNTNTNNSRRNRRNRPTITEQRVSSPVERQASNQSAPSTPPANPINHQVLRTTKTKLEGVISYFNSRVTKTESFDEDHTYLLDGKRDFPKSVTGRVHINQEGVDFDTVAYGPSSALGNTADDAGRIYFENGMSWPVNYRIPNTTLDNPDAVVQGYNSEQRVKKEVEKIKDYFDQIYGAGYYGVITSEIRLGAHVKEANGTEYNLAGVPDVIVYDDKGNIYIYDFKTSRKGILDDETIAGYSQQVNIYRQMLEANFPELKGKIFAKGLFVFGVDYNAGNDTTMKYTKTKDNQVYLNGIPIQDTVNANYDAPRFMYPLIDNRSTVPLTNQDFGMEFTPLPEPNNESNNEDDEDFDYSSYVLNANSELITNDIKSNIENIPWANKYDNNGPLLAPNGKPSNLTPEQYRMVRTKEFKAWFGDWENDPVNASKIIDENGEPKVVYHSTSNNFNTFDLNKTRDRSGKAFYFKTFKDSKVEKFLFRTHDMEVFLNIRNPFIADKKSGVEPYAITNRDKITPYLSNNDGVIGFSNPKIADKGQLNNGINSNSRHDGIELVAFNPNQIKSATDNNGQFSTENNNIYKADSELITSTEIHTESIEIDADNNPTGIRIAPDMNTYIKTFPTAIQLQIKQLVASGEINYSCM